MLISTGCKDKTVSPPSKKIDAGQPVFTKEGSLTFLASDGKILSHIDIEIADNPAEREKGLMNRSLMPNNEGMLFLFDIEEPQAFWMKNTILPLDIIYVNAAMNIVTVAENTTPFSEASIPSHFPAQYVVEVNAGYCSQYLITAGCKIAYTRD